MHRPAAPLEPGAAQLDLPLPEANRSRAAGRSQLRREAPARLLRLVAPPAADEDRLAETLLSHLPSGKALSLTLTDNRYSMVAVRRYPDGYKVRIHRMFSAADPRVVRALARYVVHNDRRASVALGDYIEQNKHIIKEQPRRVREPRLRTLGRNHDLQAVFDALNRRYFAGLLQAKITWGPASKPRRRRSIKMGSFSIEDRIIRIHTSLDQATVPGYFLDWIVFHEMLHGKHEVVRDEGGRRCFHSKAFLAEERTFDEYARASAWERRNIDRLLEG